MRFSTAALRTLEDLSQHSRTSATPRSALDREDSLVGVAGAVISGRIPERLLRWRVDSIDISPRFPVVEDWTAGGLMGIGVCWACDRRAESDLTLGTTTTARRSGVSSANHTALGLRAIYSPLSNLVLSCNHGWTAACAELIIVMRVHRFSLSPSLLTLRSPQHPSLTLVPLLVPLRFVLCCAHLRVAATPVALGAFILMILCGTERIYATSCNVSNSDASSAWEEGCCGRE